MTIGRPTLARQAYAEIQSKILSGELSAGQRLLPDELAQELAVSQTPIKEALALLERDGLVTGTDRRASLVRRFSVADIGEIYEARILLETNALSTGFAASRVDAAFIRKASDLCQAQLRLMPARSQGVLVKAIALDREFHEMIMKLGGNEVLTGWHQSIQLRIQTVRTYSVETYVFERMSREHQRIIDAFAGGRIEEMVAALRDHLVSSRDDLIARRPDELPVR
ncbi:GntR family transcriptional regulator [Aureimonas sp. SA4125]|uniref:GntR family transcriptional regulator n=1 Tax=Aureimonas sp. SA4125 TaxID=2826993 RepID=UPI001CC38EB4|nr:GntR family transcriptional regulator [Aureimonas sp. SA4125]BDA83134.1 GntR family transcriptional regulator [Aureimonas sp. SA4125]